MRTPGCVRAALLAAVGIVLAPWPFALAQTLEEVERQVEAAERQQREQQAAARREAEARAAREAQARREREQAAAAAARLGTLIVRSDTDCALVVNGENQGQVQAERTQQVRVPPGESLIECVASDGRRAEVTERIPSGEQAVVRLTMPPPERFTQRSEGIFDRDQGVIWAASDNGSDIDWNGARNYCASKGGGWSLPSSAQLQSLYDEAGTHGRSWTSPWNGQTYTIKFATPLIRWTSCCFWSSETSGSAEAVYVYLVNGNRVATTVSLSVVNRALCVRRP